MKIKNFKVRSKKELTILLYHGVTDIKSNGIENYSKNNNFKNEFLNHALIMDAARKSSENNTIIKIKI